MPDAIKVDGLREFQRNLKKIDADLPKQLRKNLNSAADVVVEVAQRRMPKRTGKAARTVKAKSTQTAVRVSAGSKARPYVPWLDYGGRVGRNGSVKRKFLPKGRYLYPAYYQVRDSGQLRRKVIEALLTTAAAAGVEVDRG